jgi:hypothetical protein
MIMSTGTRISPASPIQTEIKHLVMEMFTPEFGFSVRGSDFLFKYEFYAIILGYAYFKHVPLG